MDTGVRVNATLAAAWGVKHTKIEEPLEEPRSEKISYTLVRCFCVTTRDVEKGVHRGVVCKAAQDSYF